MTNPGSLVGAVNGASYTGAFGSDAGGVARLVAGLVAGARERQAQQQAAAMDAALLKLRQDSEAATIANMQHDNDLADKQYTANRTDADRNFGLHKDSVLSEIADRTASRDIQNRGLTEKERHNRAEEALLATKPKPGESVPSMDENGYLGMIDKATNTFQYVLGPNGNRIQGRGAIPNTGEQQNAMLYQSIEPSLGRIDSYFATHGAPSTAAQTLAEHAGSGLTGGLANMVLGTVDPEYQKALTDIIGVYRAYVYATTGKQINESEAKDAKKRFTILAGDTEATKRQKLATIHQMADAIKRNSQRALNFQAQLSDETGGASQGTPAPNASTPSLPPLTAEEQAKAASDPGFRAFLQSKGYSMDRAAALKRKYGLDDGQGATATRVWTLPDGRKIHLEP